jgi:hypothetical protein
MCVCVCVIKTGNMDHKNWNFLSLIRTLPERIPFLHKIASKVLYLVKKYTAFLSYEKNFYGDRNSHNTEFPIRIWSVAVDTNS